jgi:hypothetical protein
MTNSQDVGSGVMMWVPPAQVEVTATAQTFSRLSVDTENREGKFEHRTCLVNVHSRN